MKKKTTKLVPVLLFPFLSPFQLIEGINFFSCAENFGQLTASLHVQNVMEQITQKNHLKCKQA